LLKIIYTVFLLSVILFMSESGNAQNVHIGLKGGLSVPNLSSGSTISGVSSGYRSISGPDFAIFSEFKLNKKFSLETSIEWSRWGGQTDGIQKIPTSEYPSFLPPGSSAENVYANFVGVAKLDYVMLPVLLKYTIPLDHAGHWKFYFDGGLFGAYMLSATGSVSGSSKIYYDKEETQPVDEHVFTVDSSSDIKSRLHTGNFGITGNLGINYQLKRSSVFAEFGGSYGLVNLQKDEHNGVSHARALVIRIGFMTPIWD
jgi:hypothetical protein